MWKLLSFWIWSLLTFYTGIIHDCRCPFRSIVFASFRKDKVNDICRCVTLLNGGSTVVPANWDPNLIRISRRRNGPLSNSSAIKWISACSSAIASIPIQEALILPQERRIVCVVSGSRQSFIGRSSVRDRNRNRCTLIARSRITLRVCKSDNIM